MRGRSRSIKRYNFLYKNLKLKNKSDRTKCFYCGADASTIDHQPPISLIENLITTNTIFEAVKVPCCYECNVILSNSNTLTLSERFELLKEKLRSRYKKDIKVAATWTNEELREMGDSLRRMIFASMGIGLEAEERILYRGHEVKISDEYWNDPQEISYCKKCEVYYYDECPLCGRKQT